ncbi:MAG: hypothetical protein ACREBW_00215, partial [Candidatus Micrarchaeaceae archaeon]
IDSVARAANLDKGKLHEGLSARLEELKSTKAEVDKIPKYIEEAIDIADLINNKLKIQTKQVYFPALVSFSRTTLRNVVTSFVEKHKDIVFALQNKSGELVVVSGDSCTESAVDYANKIAHEAKRTFKGGGSKRIAEGRLI